MLQNDSFVSPDALAPNGGETIAIRRPVPITEDTRPPEIATGWSRYQNSDPLNAAEAPEAPHKR